MRSIFNQDAHVEVTEMTPKHHPVDNPKGTPPTPPIPEKYFETVQIITQPQKKKTRRSEESPRHY
jgi:hypothetical protein